MATIVLATRGTSGVPEFAGSTWVRLHYCLGLLGLGHRVVWHDRFEKPINPERSRRALPYFVRRFQQMANDFGFGDSFRMSDPDGRHLAGLSDDALGSVCDSADLLLAISESPPPQSPLVRIPRRAFVDVDPGFTQLWAEQVDMGLDMFTDFFTIGLNIGEHSSPVPLGGRTWHRILPPVAIDWWPARIDPDCESFTTVTDWHARQKVTWNGDSYSGKRVEFMKLIDLPKHTPASIVLASGIEGDYRDGVLFTEHGWTIVDSYRFAGDVHAYQEFIQHSRGEFSVAKEGYVKLNTGWISDRTAAYLASGKPALVQSTGLEPHLPTGKGLVTFRTLDEAVAGLEAINADYVAHCHAARAVAEQHFASSLVLPRLLALAGVPSPGHSRVSA